MNKTAASCTINKVHFA